MSAFTTDRETGSAGTPSPEKKRKGRRRDRATDQRLNWRLRLRRDRTLIIMTVPALALIIAFNYLPMFGAVTAFQFYDYLSGFFHSPWAGLANFQQLFSDSNFWHAFENTLVLSLVQLVLFFPVPIALAIMLNSVLSTKLRSFFQAVVYLPHFFSWVLVVTLFQEMLGGAGLLNHVLRLNDMGVWNIMTDPGAFKYLVTAQAVWKEAGWGIIVFLAAIAAIDPNLYEAAAADGAGRWRRMWHITLPGMRGVIVLMLVLRLGNALTVGFEQFLIQRNAVGSGASEVLDTYAYYYGVIANNYGLGTAAGLFKGVVSLILILAANKLAHYFGEDGLYRRSR
ncbi:ABC transporter permease [Phaeacidiphilus oryzae]|uniref:ABC transporter permease n=1 Tax=Phaeacidiphilus oryzae TaxID=348818 RepID=UPI00068B4EDC|nr:ABC transporter permease subunit [Phaeacidiphilus oryzae]